MAHTCPQSLWSIGVGIFLSLIEPFLIKRVVSCSGMLLVPVQAGKITHEAFIWGLQIVFQAVLWWAAASRHRRVNVAGVRWTNACIFFSRETCTVAPSHMEPEHAPRLECLINDAFFLLSEQNKQPCQDSAARRGGFGPCGPFLLDAKERPLNPTFECHLKAPK